MECCSEHSLFPTDSFWYVVGLEILEIPLTLIYFAYTPFVISGVYLAAKRYKGYRIWRWLAQVSVGLGIIQYVRSIYEFFGGLPGTF